MQVIRRMTRARVALVGVATVSAAAAITALIAQPGTAAALPSSGSGQWPLADRSGRHLGHPGQGVLVTAVRCCWGLMPRTRLKAALRANALP